MDNALGQVILGPHLEPWGAGGHGAPMEDVARSIAEAMLALFEEYGVAMTPLVVMRLEDVLSSYLVVRRLQQAMWLTETEEQESARASVAAMAAAAEPLAKARERLRKAMKELEDLCAKAGTPIDVGLAERVQPLLERTKGVLDDALSHGKDQVAPVKKRAGSKSRTTQRPRTR
jgi:hypothetical protein